jgi:DNA topoisomerase I
MTKLVIVESPAKAKTIAKYLGKEYVVEASIGHIRDLPRNAADIPASKKSLSWVRLGVDIENDFEPLYIVPSEKKSHIQELKKQLKNATELYLATDEDREGESISWHLVQVLKPKVPTYRLVFHEITKKAIQRALKQVREVDTELVEAQETRRIVDRLYGYFVSPLLWKKVRPQLSAGRVQSVAVRMVVECEQSRIEFVSADWWGISSKFSYNGEAFDGILKSWQGKGIATGKDFDETGKKVSKKSILLTEDLAKEICDKIDGKNATVKDVSESKFSENPSAPFITSTLQQEANRKLRWSAKRTMSTAQRLYENGWITYMRTDSPTLSEQAINASRTLIATQYGQEFLPESPRKYSTKSKGAQEAHEAIRPAGESFRLPKEASQKVSPDEAKLYELIWQRTIASQMKNAAGNRVRVSTEISDGIFISTGKSYLFYGFRRAYVEGVDNPNLALAEREKILPILSVGNTINVDSIIPNGHKTNPPARLTEATLVKSLEEKGIGRPSTYASIIDTILSRGYVFKKGTALVPTFTAFVVTRLLSTHLEWLVDYSFTARMESRLDEIASGDADHLEVLKSFYHGNEGLVATIEIAQDQIDPREICGVAIGRATDNEEVQVRVGKYGEFLKKGDINANIPENMPPDELSLKIAIEMLKKQAEGPICLGTDPLTEKPVYLKEGRFGTYLQLGDPEEVPKKRGKGMKVIKPRNASLLPNMTAKDITLELAISLLSLPRVLGERTDAKGETLPVMLCNGRYGPYVQSGKTSVSIPEKIKPLEITLEEAKELLANPPKRARGSSVLHELGEDDKDNKIQVKKGRFGAYVTDGTTNASIPKGSLPEDMTLEEALSLIKAREGAPKRKRKKTTRKKKKKTK